MFSVKWKLTELKQDKPVKVFTIFSCGGGSSMGYKRAGFQVIGNCEIDPEMNEVYVRNQHPRYNYLMDARDFLKQEDLPEELYNLDILDGSPPCSTFSMCGAREKGWGKEKVFREGQKKQTLDDLFFVFLDVVEKLKPKIVVAENVTGLVQGNAKGYVNQIINRFRELGYQVQLFKLNAAFMEVPQKRERVFFIANRVGYPKLKLEFNYPVIPFGKIRTEEPGKPFNQAVKKLLDMCRPGENQLSDVNMRIGGKQSYFNYKVVWDDMVANTLVGHEVALRGCDKTLFSNMDVIHCQTFPEDFDFVKNSGDRVQYVCGMSVPPNMMAHIAHEIWMQWLRKDKE